MPSLPAELAACLAAVELDYLLGRGVGWDQVQPWNETLSGGEKQRLAMARLLFHKPAYAIMDECTSAVSAPVQAESAWGGGGGMSWARLSVARGACAFISWGRGEATAGHGPPAVPQASIRLPG
jgi:hypothetical protein